MKGRVALVLAVSAMSAPVGVAPVRAQEADLAARLTIDPAVRMGRLENGIRYYIRHNGRPENRAELMLVVNAGSLLEDDDQRGLAHFVEHMAFNGTRNFPKQELVSYLESIGMQFGADLNAYTGFDETVYMLTVPTDTGTALERGIQILEDWSHQQTFDPEEIGKERGVVVEEWRLGQGAGARIRDRIFPILLRGSRYAERLPIGTQASLESFDPAALRRFYTDWYRPELMAVVAVGDFDVDTVETTIREHFSNLPRSSGGRERAVYPVPDHTEPLVAIATDPEATSASVEVYWKRDPDASGTLGDYRRSIVASLYNGMLNGRLAELSRIADPPFIGASSNGGALLRSKDAYILSALVQDGQALRGLEAVLTEGERVARFGFTETELAREKLDIARAYETAFAEREKTNSIAYANEYLRNFLEDEPIPGIAVEFDLVKRFLEGITLDEVNALAGDWMNDQNRVVVAQGPEKAGAEMPTEAQLLAVFDTVAAKTLTPYVDVVADALIATLPSPGSIVQERRIERIDAVEWTLSNGVRVILKPTTYKDDEVVFRAWSPGGLSLVDDGDYMSAGFSTTLVGASGLGELDATALQKALQGKAASVRVSLDDVSEGLSGGASPKDLETLFQLIHQNLVAPRNDSIAFQSIMTRLRGLIANRAASPESAFQDSLNVILAQHHPRARPISVQVLDEVDRARAFQVYRDRFGDAGDFTFAFVGSFDIEAVRPLVLQYLASLPGSGRSETWQDRGVRPPDGVVERIVRKGIEPKSQTMVVYTGPVQFNADNRLALAMLAGALDIRLRDVLREDLSGTYGVQLSQAAVRDPWQHYVFTVGFGAAPVRLDTLAASVFAEIEKIKQSGPDAATLQKVKETHRRGHETNLQQNGYWLGQIIAASQYGEPMGAFLDLPARIEAVTAEQIAQAARTFLRSDRYVRVSLFPEAGN
ncbi:MAG: M16 family metallopeptidase [Longimicrobiales bacterium]